MTWVCNYHVTWYITSILAITNTNSFLQSRQIQLISLNTTTLRPTKLELTRFASLLPSLNLTSFIF